VESLKPKDKKGRHNRIHRHVLKFIRRGSSLANKPEIIIPGKTESDGLHAERRIKQSMGITGPLPSNVYIKGLKRPCANCFPEMLKPGETQTTGCPGPGPMWLSGAAKIGDVPASNRPTRITLDRNGEYTTGYDTESDSDEE
jgi:hypothetical protein